MTVPAVPPVGLVGKFMTIALHPGTHARRTSSMLNAKPSSGRVFTGTGIPWQSFTLGEYDTKHGSWYIILSPGFIIALSAQSRTSETPTPTRISPAGS